MESLVFSANAKNFVDQALEQLKEAKDALAESDKRMGEYKDNGYGKSNAMKITHREQIKDYRIQFIRLNTKIDTLINVIEIEPAEVREINNLLYDISKLILTIEVKHREIYE